MKKRVEVQKRILETLKHLEQTRQKQWWDILDILFWVYRPEQVDPDHERNRGLIGWRPDWKTHTWAERVSIIRACLNLERMGLIQSRIIRTRDDPKLNRKRIELGSHVSEWKEIRIVSASIA